MAGRAIVSKSVFTLVLLVFVSLLSNLKVIFHSYQTYRMKQVVSKRSDQDARLILGVSKKKHTNSFVEYLGSIGDQRFAGKYRK